MSFWTNLRFRRTSYLLVSLAIVAVTAVVSLTNEKGKAGIDLSLNGVRVLYGLTVATSHHQLGSPLYGFYTPVLDIFYTKKIMTWREVNGLIKKVKTIDPKSLSPEQLHIGFKELDLDDKGVILWYSAAFGLFGMHLGSIYLLYFLMLSGSLVVYWLSFRDDEPALMLMVLYPLVHLALAGYVLAGNPNVLGSLLGARPFAMLGALPALHLVLLMVRNRVPSRWLVAGMAAQIAYLLLITSVRSSAKIQVLFILAVGTFLLLRWILRKNELPASLILRRAFVWVPVSLLIGMASASAIYSAAIPSELRARIVPGHLVWFSALAGFTLNQELLDDITQFAKDFKPKNIDNGIYDARGNLKKSPSLDAVASMSVIGYAKTVLNEDISDVLFGGSEKQNYAKLEHYGRSLLFYELRQRPAAMVHLYFIDKTWNFYLIMRDVLRNLPLCDILIAAFVLGLLGGAVWLQGIKLLAPLFVAGLAVSSLPAYWFVPSTITMYDYAPYFYLCLLGAVASAGAVASLLIGRVSFTSRTTKVLPVVIVMIIPLAVAGMLVIKRLPGAAGKSTILVISATYGKNAGAPSGNATDKLRHSCNGRQSCNYLIDVGVLGDPAGGAAKDFAVDYKCSQNLKLVKQTIPAEAHNQKIMLDCAAK